MSTLLAFHDVALIRGGRLLFEGLNATLGSGEGLHVAGPNGCGKSSLLRLAAGLIKQSAGRVESAPLALADDFLALDRELPLERALRFWTGASPQPHLDALGIGALAQIPVRFLSSGEAKRASLARVVASAAQLWLLDEPLNALDADGVERLGRVIEQHRSTGGAVLAASHVLLPGDWRRLELGQ